MTSELMSGDDLKDTPVGKIVQLTTNKAPDHLIGHAALPTELERLRASPAVRSLVLTLQAEMKRRMLDGSLTPGVKLIVTFTQDDAQALINLLA